MEKGNKVLIKDTGSIWDGKHGTVIAEEDGQVEVRINFETEDGTKQVIEIFNEENLEMEREDESLNEELSQEQIDIVIRDAKDDFEKLDNPGNVSYEYELGFTAAAFNVPFKHWKAFLPGIEEDDQKYIDFKQGYLDNNGKIDESLNEDLEIKPTKKEDIIHRYVHLEDLDGKEVPNWNFAARIATAEDIEEGCVCELAHDLGYKVFSIEAPGFFRTVIAAKGIKAEDIEEEYADFLQGRACVRELKWN